MFFQLECFLPDRGKLCGSPVGGRCIECISMKGAEDDADT
jgi:hypothetical protein